MLKWSGYGSWVDQPPGLLASQRRGDLVGRYWLGRIEMASDYMERLRRLAINDARLGEVGGAEVDPRGITRMKVWSRPSLLRATMKLN